MRVLSTSRREGPGENYSIVGVEEGIAGAISGAVSRRALMSPAREFEHPQGTGGWVLGEGAVYYTFELYISGRR